MPNISRQSTPGSKKFTTTTSAVHPFSSTPHPIFFFPAVLSVTCTPGTPTFSCLANRTTLIVRSHWMRECWYVCCNAALCAHAFTCTRRSERYTGDGDIRRLDTGAAPNYHRKKRGKKVIQASSIKTKRTTRGQKPSF
jgi:hypothetical protein